MPVATRSLIVLGFLSLPLLARGQSYTGTGHAVRDGDTIRLLRDFALCRSTGTL